MPKIPEYPAVTASELDSNDQFVIDVDGTTKSITVDQAQTKLSQRQAVSPTGNYTAVLSDATRVVRMNAASANDFIVPNNSSVAFEVGTFLIVRQVNLGTTTIKADTGVTLNGSSLELAQYKAAVLHKVGTDEWDVYVGGAAGEVDPGPGGDTTPPELLSARVEDTDPDLILLEYDEELDATSTPDTTDFAVSGGRTVISVTIGSVVVDDNHYVMVEVDDPFDSEDDITISYTPGTNKIKDLHGNPADALISEPVTNNILPAGGVEDAEYDYLTGTNTFTGVAYTVVYNAGSDYYQRASGANNWGYLVGRTDKKLASGNDGGHGYLVLNLSGSYTPNIIGLHTASTPVDWTSMAIGFRIATGTSGQIFKILNGAELPVAINLGFTGTGSERVRIYREGADFKIQKSLDNGDSWATIYAFDPGDIASAGLTTALAGDLYAMADCRAAIKDPKIYNFTT